MKSLSELRDELAKKHAKHPIQDNHASVIYAWDAALKALAERAPEQFKTACENAQGHIDTHYPDDGVSEALLEAVKVIAALKAQLSMTNSGWPHEKKLHEKLASAELAIATLREAFRAAESVWRTEGHIFVADQCAKVLERTREWAPSAANKID